MPNTILLPFQPDAMTPSELAAVSYLARYSVHTHQLYAYQLRRWFPPGRADPHSPSRRTGLSARHQRPASF